MNLQKLNPWNWFKHEENAAAGMPSAAGMGSETNAGTSTFRQNQVNSLVRIQREIDRVFDDVIGSVGLATSDWRKGIRGALDWANSNLFRPNVDISGDEKTYEVSLDVPGVKTSDLSIEIRGNVMTISGEKEESREEKSTHFYRVERSRGAFRRTLALPEDADLDNIDASLTDGVLKLSIPRLESKEDVKKLTVRNPQ